MGAVVVAGRAGRALHASEARYRRLFEAIDEGFCILEAAGDAGDPLGDFVYLEANPAVEAHSGIRDVVGRRVGAVLGREAPVWIAMLAGVARSGELLRFEQALETTGRILELAVFRVEGGERPQVAVLFRDVSARREAEGALKQLNDELEQRVAEVAPGAQIIRVGRDRQARRRVYGMAPLPQQPFLGWHRQ